MKRAAAFLLLLVCATIAAVAFRDRLSADFWPMDSSRVGPNLVAALVQWVIVVLVASFLYPPLRGWIRAEIDRLHDKLDARHAEILETLRLHHHEAMTKADEHHQAHMQALTKETDE